MISDHVDALRIIDTVHYHFPDAEMQTHDGTGFFEVDSVSTEQSSLLKSLGASVYVYSTGKPNSGYHRNSTKTVISVRG